MMRDERRKGGVPSNAVLLAANRAGPSTNVMGSCRSGAAVGSDAVWPALCTSAEHGTNASSESSTCGSHRPSDESDQRVEVELQRPQVVLAQGK